MTNHRATDIALFVLLVALGAVGRLVQPDWNFNPLAACGVLAGYWFAHRTIAAAVPLLGLMLSNLALPGYDHPGVMATVVVSLAVAPLLGRWLRGLQTLGGRAAGLAVCSTAPAVVFFLLTNAAVWGLQSDYPKTAAGLADCYIAALPFLRNSLAGDMFYTCMLFSLAALAGCFPLAAGFSTNRTARSSAGS